MAKCGKARAPWPGTFGLLSLLCLIGCRDQAEADFKRCKARASAQDVPAALEFCRAAVRADAKSTAGQAAAQLLLELQQQESGRAEAKEEEDEPAPPKKAATLPELLRPEAIAREVLTQWNEAHKPGQARKLKALFAPRVFFYGLTLSAEQCVARKEEYLAKHPDFSQRISGEIQVQEESGRLRVAFKKIVGTETDQQFPSYLELVQQGGSWRIAVEGDEVTDKNLAAQARKEGSRLARTSGDFDGDGLTESMKVIKPVILDVYECKGECSCKVEFSSPKLKPIFVGNCIGASLFNEGDLDGDGSDEVGVSPEWFTSCWSGFPVYSLRSGEPRLLVGISTHCAQWEEGIHPIEKHPTKRGTVIVHSTLLGEEGFEYSSEELLLEPQKD